MHEKIMKDIEGYLIQEAYYGKLPEFEEMERLFDKVIEKVKKDQKKANPNKYPEMKKIEKLFSKIFGFKKSLIYWQPFNTEDAYTVPVNTFLIFANRKERTIEKKKNGFYDKNHSVVLTVYLSCGDILVTDMTSRELIAVILHEIGHNFDLSGYHLLSYYMDAICSLGTSVIENNKYKKMDKINDVKMDYYDKVKDNSKPFYDNAKKRERTNREVKERMEGMIKCRSKFSILNLLFNTISLPFYIVLGPFIQLGSLTTKKAELFADSFSTAYGYGVDLVTALKKLGDTTKYYKPKGAMKVLSDLGRYQYEAMNAMFEPHGSTQERCHECLKKLKNDLKSSDFSPELKEELEDEIKRIDDQYKRIVNMTDEEKGIFTKVWRKINAVIFRGSPNLIAKLFKTNKV